MAKAEKNFEVVKKYYFRKNGVLEEKGYDWIGEHHRGLYPVELDGKLGFADSNGEIVVPIIYDRENHINDTVWSGNSEYLDLKKNKLYGLIKHDGTLVVDFCWDNMDLTNLNDNLLPVALDKKWGFVNLNTGKVQVKPAYDEVKFFKNGFAPVRLEKKWGIIDQSGNVIASPKYLVEFNFVGDFAIVFEGGSFRSQGNLMLISNSNCKIITKKGTEIATDYYWIEKTGVNIFTLTREIDGQKINNIKQLIAFPDYILVIDDGDYLEGYITPEGKYSEKPGYEKEPKEYDYIKYKHAKYIGGGTWSAIDYNGNPIPLSDKTLQDVKKSLLA